MVFLCYACNIIDFDRITFSCVFVVFLSLCHLLLIDFFYRCQSIFLSIRITEMDILRDACAHLYQSVRMFLSRFGFEKGMWDLIE